MCRIGEDLVYTARVGEGYEAKPTRPPSSRILYVQRVY